jgi:hypothetical protein
VICTVCRGRTRERLSPLTGCVQSPGEVPGRHTRILRQHRGMGVAAMTLDAYLGEWFALPRTRVQPTTLRGSTDMADAYLRRGSVCCASGSSTSGR